jgi:hypothetical protein
MANPHGHTIWSQRKTFTREYPLVAAAISALRISHLGLRCEH